MKYNVIRDTREKFGHGWDFAAGKNCAGMEVATLPEGDYTLKGYEQEIVVERKGSVSEISMNIFEDRFERELIRLESYTHPFLLMEFTMDDVMNFPKGSGIPTYKWASLKVTPFLILKKLAEFQLRYKTKFIFCGKHGKEVCASLFKRFLEYENVS